MVFVNTSVKSSPDHNSTSKMCKRAYLLYSCGHTSDGRRLIVECPSGECSGVELSTALELVPEECSDCKRITLDAEAERDSEYANTIDVETIVRRFYDARDVDGLNEFNDAFSASTARPARRSEIMQQESEESRRRTEVLRRELDALQRGNEQLYQQIRAAETGVQPPSLRRADNDEDRLRRMVFELQDPAQREREWNQLQLINQAELEELNELERKEHEAEARQTGD